MAFGDGCSCNAAAGELLVSTSGGRHGTRGEENRRRHHSRRHPFAEQALLEDLVLANRILTREVGILDVQAHVSARSKTNPDHWYMARFVAPGGASLSDMVEYDLESTPVQGPRNDNARETFLHGQVFKARPDVMAVVHAHTPEFVAFGMSSVPLYWGPNRQVPVWDIRPVNNGRSGIVSNNALGQSMAEKMGNNEAVLLWGHGITLTAKSLPEVIHRVRRTAQQCPVADGVRVNGQSGTAGSHRR